MSEYNEEGGEYGSTSAGGNHMDPRHRGLDGRDGSPSWLDKLPTTKFDRNTASAGTISADISQQSPVRPEGKPNVGSLGG